MEKKEKIVKKESDGMKKNSDNKFIGWLKNNQINLLYGLAGLIIGVLVMGILWPERVAKLENGEQVVAEVDTIQVTADDIYGKLKTTEGLNVLVSMIDSSILKSKYEIDEEANEYATTQAEQYYTMYENYYGMTKEDFLSGSGFKDEEEFLDYLREEFLYQKYYEDYLASLVTEDEINDFYKDEVFGERKIYVFSSANKDNSLEKIRKSLKNGTKPTKLKDKYDDVTFNEIESITFDAEGYSETFLKEVAKLEKGKYSAVFQDDNYGYTVIYVNSVKDVPELKYAEDSIISILGARKDAQDANLYYKAFIELREAYKLKFYDEDLETLYEEQMSAYTKTEEEKSEEE